MPRPLVTELLRKARGAVSADRHRFRDYDFDLDLSYITDNVIAMAFPSAGMATIWRNHIDEVRKLLQRYHGDKYRIFNLSGLGYDYGKFNNQVVDYAFPDHHAPPMNLLFDILRALHSYLCEDSENVAVVHCVGGKGRTGTVIACYLMFSGLFPTVETAMKHFAQARSAAERGVTQPSQQRYCRYLGQILSSEIYPKPRPLVLEKIILEPVPNFCGHVAGCRPILEIFSTHRYPKELLFCSQEYPEGLQSPFGTQERARVGTILMSGMTGGGTPTVPRAVEAGPLREQVRDPNRNIDGDDEHAASASLPPPRLCALRDGWVEIPVNCVVQGDFMVFLSHFRKKKKVHMVARKPLKIMRMSLHTQFVPEQGDMTIDLADLDDISNRRFWPQWFDENFKLTLRFAGPPPQAQALEDARMKTTNKSSFVELMQMYRLPAVQTRLKYTPTAQAQEAESRELLRGQSVYNVRAIYGSTRIDNTRTVGDEFDGEARTGLYRGKLETGVPGRSPSATVSGVSDQISNRQFSLYSSFIQGDSTANMRTKQPVATVVHVPHIEVETVRLSAGLEGAKSSTVDSDEKAKPSWLRSTYNSEPRRTASDSIQFPTVAERSAEYALTMTSQLEKAATLLSAASVTPSSVSIDQGLLAALNRFASGSKSQTTFPIGSLAPEKVLDDDIADVSSTRSSPYARFPSEVVGPDHPEVTPNRPAVPRGEYQLLSTLSTSMDPVMPEQSKTEAACLLAQRPPSQTDKRRSVYAQFPSNPSDHPPNNIPSKTYVSLRDVNVNFVEPSAAVPTLDGVDQASVRAALDELATSVASLHGVDPADIIDRSSHSTRTSQIATLEPTSDEAPKVTSDELQSARTEDGEPMNLATARRSFLDFVIPQSAVTAESDVDEIERELDALANLLDIVTDVDPSEAIFD